MGFSLGLISVPGLFVVLVFVLVSFQLLVGSWCWFQIWFNFCWLFIIGFGCSCWFSFCCWVVIGFGAKLCLNSVACLFLVWGFVLVVGSRVG